MFPDFTDKIKILTMVMGLLPLDLCDHLTENYLYIRLSGHLNESSKLELPSNFVIQHSNKCSLTNSSRSNNRYHLELMISITDQGTN